VQFGFVIDQSRCIGCHACTVACKAENEVPLGSFRTWVKYDEKGVFPAVRRHFTVLRCNHCDAAPCIEICPVQALSKRPDAIVDLDRDLCIGCRACMQGCPYDALYFHEAKGVAEKCHYCAHRTEIGLEPACVIVCPVEAIVSGDVDDKTSRIGKLIESQTVSRRKVEKGTRPRVWYVDALAEALVPGRSAEPPAYLWSERAPGDAPPPVVPGYEPTPDIVTTLDVPHPPAWGWHVWTYLVTKNAAAGAAIAAPALAWLGAAGFAERFVPEILSLALLAITCFLLVHDLGRPDRFLKILFHPNQKSWLVKGTWALMAFGGISVATLGLFALGQDAPARLLRAVNVPLAFVAAGYSAWLFAQCRGRDLWMQGGLFLQLSLRALLFGSMLAMLVGSDAISPHPSWIFAATALATALALLADLRTTLPTADGRRAQWILLESIASERPLALLVTAAAIAAASRYADGSLAIAMRASAALAASFALFVYERAWIRAGQAVPLS
jgi:Fe-S-cluster-containing dehydrogenase component